MAKVQSALEKLREERKKAKAAEKERSNLSCTDVLADATIDNPQNLSKYHTGENKAEIAIKKADAAHAINKEQSAYIAHLEIMREYQRNIKELQQIQADIMKGIQEGKAELELFLLAADGIARATHNRVFYDGVVNDIRAIYGDGLQQSKPLELELKEVQARKEKLIQAEQRQEDRKALQRIRRAIDAHERKEQELKTAIAASIN